MEEMRSLSINDNQRVSFGPSRLPNFEMNFSKGFQSLGRRSWTIQIELLHVSAT